MKKHVRNIKKFAIARPVITIVAVVVAVLAIYGTAFAAIHSIDSGKPTVPTTKRTASPSPSPTPTPSPSQSATPSPSANPSASPSPAASSKPSSSPKKSTKGSSQLDPACMQKLNAGYSKYNTDLAAENAEHRATLAQLKADYDNGEYDDEYGNPNNAAYQSDVDDENVTWQHNTAAIYETFQQIQTSTNNCQ